MITLHPSTPLAAAIAFAHERGHILITDGKRIASAPAKDVQPGWRRLRTGVKRIKG